MKHSADSETFYSQHTPEFLKCLTHARADCSCAERILAYRNLVRPVVYFKVSVGETTDNKNHFVCFLEPRAYIFLQTDKWGCDGELDHRHVLRQVLRDWRLDELQENFGRVCCADSLLVQQLDHETAKPSERTRNFGLRVNVNNLV